MKRLIGLIAATALAWSPQVDAATNDAIEIPFAPPLDQPLHLHRAQVRSAGTAKAVRNSSDETLVFAARNDKGYVLRWTSRNIAVEADPARRTVLQAIAGASEGMTSVIQTDPSGTPESLINRAEMRAMLSTAIDRAKQASGSDQVVQNALDAAMANFGGLSDEGFDQIFLEEPQRLFGLGGASLVPGEEKTFQTVAALPLAGQPVHLAGSLVLAGRDAHGIHLVVQTRTDPADVKATVQRFLATIFAKLPADQRAKLQAAVSALEGFELHDRLDLTLDPVTGLPTAADYSKTVTVNGADTVETIAYNVLP